MKKAGKIIFIILTIYTALFMGGCDMDEQKDKEEVTSNEIGELYSYEIHFSNMTTSEITLELYNFELDLESEFKSTSEFSVQSNKKITLSPAAIVYCTIIAPFKPIDINNLKANRRLDIYNIYDVTTIEIF